MRKIGNERDLEVGELLKFIKKYKPESGLDVGAHWTWNSYAPDVRKLLKKYDGVDIAKDDLTERIVDLYYRGNITEINPQHYDLVFSISSIEHAGISTYKKADYTQERLKVFTTMYELANKYLFITCPFGEPMLIEGQYANITVHDLLKWQNAINGGSILDCEFYYTKGQNMPFLKCSPQEAAKVKFDETIGIPQCIAIIKAVK